MGKLRDLLLEELDKDGVGKVWYELIHAKVVTLAGGWPPKDFKEFEPDAMNGANWKYSKKLDLTQKLFEERILHPDRKSIDYILSGVSDAKVRVNVSVVVNQFLNQVTRGADDKRVFDLILTRLNQISFTLTPTTGGSGKFPTVLSNEETAKSVKRILMSCKERLPNAFVPAVSEEERNSPIWKPAGYDAIVQKIIKLPGPLTEYALRGGIADALTVLRLTLYYTDNTPEGAMGDRLGFSGEEAVMLDTTAAFNPQDHLELSSDAVQARQVISKLTPESRMFLGCIAISKNKVTLAANLGVSRGTALKREADAVREVNDLFDALSIPDSERQSIRGEILKNIPHPGES